MPKRGGGGGSQRYNNNAGNGNGSGGGGSGGSRFSALKDYDDDDHQRRKDRNKRRVSFKTSQFPHKSDVKLRLQDVRRWDEDDDMSEMTTTIKDRPSSRRRGSPIPRGKFGKLVPNGAGWYQVTIQNGQIYEKETLLRALLAAMSPHAFIPQYWRTERHCVIFFTDDFEVAERIQQLGRHAQLPDGFRLMPRVRSGIPLVTIDEDFKAKMKAVMAKRYNLQTKALDLSRFHADQDLKPFFCPLFRVNVMSAALDIICDNIPDLEAINLNDNNMSTMESFKGADKRLPHLKILYLGDNNLPSLAHLLVFRNLPIIELVLRNNPCRLRYKDPQQFVSEVRRKFPKILKLDGETLPPQVHFDLNESSVLPPAKASFLCDSAGADVVRQFLDQYFSIFDSDNRQPLLDAYHEHAMLSISMPSVSQSGSRLNNFWKFNRNLRRLNSEREDLRIRLLKSGRLACVSTLDEWPRTLHERRTFTVDLTIYNPQMMLFTVTGLFKELTGDTSAGTPSNMQAYELRHFMRTFVVVPQNSGFCIRNETIFLNSATCEQTREFKRTQHQPAPGADMAVGLTPIGAAAVAEGSIQNRLQPSQAVPGAPVALLATPSPSNPTAVPAGGNAAALNDATKMQMVQAMSAQSQMNLDWSRKCLEETNWDFNHAAFVFEKLFKENKIPPEAFVK
ncbi:PREDICTED: nuclear RNA export factor 1 isoform X1 [Drosophila arizonae]|uniref:Nuclear RNA export factor 1 isoform X1 n=1 Tax=Drosophila arizonae TaxID=7263 RepID=A0ABM1PRL7_DROAR|nr:PREDICTED: nuclear RNA export factor 1 isoform X1 [Drosophila arizonae]XP_017869854.1 PREDICTED: nuclear RNA export factor 1 isoform X1 [Drosophila arizonae]